MRFIRVIFGALALALVAQQCSSTVMLGSLLMALKGGLFVSKVGLGGLLAMALAGTLNQRQDNVASPTTSVAYGKTGVRRSKRSALSAAELPIQLNATEETESENEIVGRLAANLNNISSPITRRMMRQVAILDQLSCLPKVICGLNTREPSKKTSAINDYGFLIKYLFERDEDGDAAEQDDEEEDDDDAKKRADVGGLTEKTRQEAMKTPDDSDEEESDSAEELIQKQEEAEEDQLDDMAQDELLEDEPELLSFAMAEMKNGHKKKPRIPGINKNYGLDHSDVSGYNKEDYFYRKNPLLNTDTASKILYEPSKYNFGPPPLHKGWNIGNKNVRLQIKKEKSPGLLSSISSYLYKKVNSDKLPKERDPTDPFASDPFFDGFRRSLSLPEGEGSSAQVEDIRTNFKMQRRNSRFNSLNPLKFFQQMREELRNTTDPVKKYQIAEEVGRRTKNSRQCRMLFAKCPYTYSEITTMIDNVKKLVSAQATLGDKIVNLKQAGSSSGAEGASASKGSGSAIEVPISGGGGSGGITQISHLLENGDKVEILLKIKPKEDVHVMKVHHVTPELEAANRTLQEMRKALQAIAKLHNQTDLPYGKHREQSIAELLQEKLTENKGTKTFVAPPTTSTTATMIVRNSSEASSQEALKPTIQGSYISVPLKKKIKRRPPTSTPATSTSQEDDGEEDDDDEDEDEDEDDDFDDIPLGIRDPSGQLHFYRDQSSPPGPSINRRGPMHHGPPPPKPSSTTRGQQQQQLRPTSDGSRRSPTSGGNAEGVQNTFYIKVDPIPIPQSTSRPERVNKVRPPSILPPRPGPYKLKRRKGNRSSQEEEQEEETTTSPV